MAPQGEILYNLRRWIFSLILPILLLLFVFPMVGAQEPPPKPMVVTVTAQNLSFGAFAHGASGGTVTISPGGLRTSTGDIILLGLGYSYSTTLYEVLANPGTVVSILNGPDVVLPGSNGGSITLSIGVSNPVSPFVISLAPPVPTLLNIGGTITVGNSAANPPGNYGGTYDITFIQE